MNEELRRAVHRHTGPDAFSFLSEYTFARPADSAGPCMAFSTLPSEICALICDEVDQSRTLTLLCRTSRLFRDQAQYILYHSVDLRDRDMRTVKSWARTVTRHSHLAERVHALALCLPTILTFATLDRSIRTTASASTDG
jgi:hypothetical protein